MAQRVVSLVKTDNIPSCSIININQIKVHLVPTRGDQFCETNLELKYSSFGDIKPNKKNHVFHLQLMDQCYFANYVKKNNQTFNPHP